MSRLAAVGLHVRLGRREVLRGVDLALEPGRLTVILGPNGAGKTTLLRALAGLVPPVQGAALLDGEPVHRLARGRRAQRIAYLPQGGSVAWPLPVAAVAALGRLPHGERPERPTEAGCAAVEAALAAVDLLTFRDRPATELSGGERARLLLARALAVNAPVLLADEPVAALDPRHQLLALDALRRAARDGALVVAIMHDLSLAARFADMIVLLQEGRVAVVGSPASVLTPERLRAAFDIEAALFERDGIPVIAPWRPS